MSARERAGYRLRQGIVALLVISVIVFVNGGWWFLYAAPAVWLVFGILDYYKARSASHK